MSYRALALILLVGCNKPAGDASAPKANVESNVKLSTSDPATVVASIGAQKVSAGEVEELAKDKLKKLNAEYLKQTYEARRQAIEEIVVKKMVGEEAKKANQKEEDYLRTQVEGAVKPPAEAEIKKFFDENQDKMRGTPYDQIKPRISEFLLNQKRQETAAKMIEDMKKKNNVVILLKEPEEERVTVAAKGPSKGPADAKVTIVEFSDFQCPFCSKANETIQQVMKTYDGKVRLVFRDYPLPFHDKAQKAAEAGLCANAQGKFWALHDHMFKNQGALDVAELKKAAKANGLDSGKFDACLDGGEFAKDVAANMNDGQAVGVSGTPAFFINGRMLSGAQPFEKFKAVIDSELASAK